MISGNEEIRVDGKKNKNNSNSLRQRNIGKQVKEIIEFKEGEMVIDRQYTQLKSYLDAGQQTIKLMFGYIIPDQISIESY